MRAGLLTFLLLVAGAVAVAAAWRLYAIYRRRRRWKLLTTSDHSLHIARERIAASPQPTDED